MVTARPVWPGRDRYKRQVSSTCSSGTVAAVSAPVLSAVQSTRNRLSRHGSVGCGAGSGRNASAATDATGWPVASASATRTASGPAGARCTRSWVASVASTLTPRHEKGSSGPSPAATNSPRPIACRAASTSAGWMPKPAACPVSVRATSANTSPARRHAARSPRNAGP